MAIFYLTDEGIDTEYQFSVLFKNGMGVRSGSEVKMLGQKIGQVSNVKIFDNVCRVLIPLIFIICISVIYSYK